MASSSCPRKKDSSSDRDPIARLLQTGAVFNQPPAEILAVAGRLESLGLIKVAHREYVECVNFRDRDVPRNRDCCGKIYVDPRLDEGGDDYRCPQCDRVVYPLRYRKQRFKDVLSRVVPDGVLAYVLGELTRLKAPVKELAKAVWRADIGELGVTVCILDYCPERFLTHDWARSQPTLYIGVNEQWLRERFLQEKWLTRASLADLISGIARLEDLLSDAADSARLASVPNASVPVYARATPPIFLQARPAARKGRSFVVEMSHNIVRVNGETVINPQAGPRFHLFRILGRRFTEDFVEGRAAVDYRPMALKEMADALGAETGTFYEDLEGVRRNLNRLQDDIERVVKQKLGDPINRDDVIQTCPWKGQGKNESGYRLNPFTVTLRPFQIADSTRPV